MATVYDLVGSGALTCILFTVEPDSVLGSQLLYFVFQRRAALLAVGVLMQVALAEDLLLASLAIFAIIG